MWVDGGNDNIAKKKARNSTSFKFIGVVEATVREALTSNNSK